MILKFYKTVGYAGLIFVALMLIAVCCTDKTNQNQKPLTAEEKQQAMIDKQFVEWNGRHHELTWQIQKRMYDYKSFRHVRSSRIISDDHIIVMMRYSGLNLFGVRLTKVASLHTNFEGTKIWNVVIN